MPKILRKPACLFSFLVFFSGICFSETSTFDIIEPAGGGTINYSTGKIRASGIGVSPGGAQNPEQKRNWAKAAAVTAARKKLLEALKEVRIDSETTVGNLDARNEMIKAEIKGFIENSREIEAREYSDGSIEVTVEVSLRGQLSKSLLKNLGSLVPAAKLYEKQTYTGLVVDCIGLGIKPAMAPKILDEGGKEIYGSSYVSEEYALSQGIVEYSNSLTAAVTNSRVGTNPIVLKGLIPDGRMQVNVIIKNSNADNLEKINETYTFLRQCRVIFVL